MLSFRTTASLPYQNPRRRFSDKEGYGVVTEFGPVEICSPSGIAKKKERVYRATKIQIAVVWVLEGVTRVV